MIFLGREGLIWAAGYDRCSTTVGVVPAFSGGQMGVCDTFVASGSAKAWAWKRASLAAGLSAGVAKAGPYAKVRGLYSCVARAAHRLGEQGEACVWAVEPACGVTGAAIRIANGGDVIHNRA